MGLALNNPQWLICHETKPIYLSYSFSFTFTLSQSGPIYLFQSDSLFHFSPLSVSPTLES